MRASGASLGLSWAPSALAAVPGMPVLPPYLTFNFTVEIDGLLVAGFSQVSGLESQVQVEEYQEGGVSGFTHKLPGRTTHGNLVLERGLTADSQLWNWFYATTQGEIQRRNGTIMLLDPRHIPVMWWNFRRALPIRWSGPRFDARNDEVSFEAIELVHEGLTKPLLGQAAAAAHTALGFVM
ncbi:MAG TPA: phage tail protein [Actinoplanes sp.]|nr:phage tail protein [Actinoplanes sp.]